MNKNPKKAAIKQGLEIASEEVQVIKIMPKPVMNLDQTIQVLDELWRKQKHRANLSATIDNLNSFEIKRADDEMGEGGSYYSGCELTIKDDERRTFTTKIPVLIKDVVAYLQERCTARLMEIEAEIVLPAGS